MAIIRYDLVSMNQDGTTTVANVRYNIGAVTTENEINENGVTVAVTRFRRTSTVGTETITKTGTAGINIVDGGEIVASGVPSLDVMRADLNTALAAKATELGHTPLEGQTNE